MSLQTGQLLYQTKNVPSSKVTNASAQLQMMFMQLERILRQEYRRNGTVRHSETIGPILGLLHEFKAITPSQIANLTLLPTPSISRALNHLLNAHEISHHINPLDGRSSIFYINQHGQDHVKEMRAQSYAILTGQNNSFNNTDMEIIKDSVNIIINMLKRINPNYSTNYLSEPIHNSEHSTGTLRMLTMHMSKYMRQGKLNSNIHPTQINILQIIENYGQITPSELGDMEYLQRSSVTQMLAPLLSRGLIEKLGGSTDARYRYQGLTDNGKEFLSQLKEEQDQRLQILLTELNSSELSKLNKCTSIINSITSK
ncbi:MAG: MarR family transcriptional regulator [Acinetobacter populi]|jgi:DNA-binding MarR family transcriptional regulator|uniref:MarR family winged helix-turn-helix transcriptional regulator n=1 Tax=Acinetobacter populi TaxID=1582270 RepID=UPI00235224F5|nr:MarR family transcriptional regulator [Acinetobacter populi]MCH4247127.1 MarR family transcriptional regulator [Acinetobacter populi]